MRDEKLYTVQWSQTYVTWPSQPEPKPEPEVEDLTLAREVLAGIMQKRT
jgi:hypothetical protein